MQTGSDLVSAGFPVSNPLLAIMGSGLSNVQSPNVPPRSNLEFGPLLGTVGDTAIAASGVVLAAVVPALPGMTVTKMTVLAGATAEATGSHGFLALYSGIGTPALLGQTADITGAAAVAASTAFTGTLASAVTLTTSTAPYGYVYAAVSFTATTMPTLISGTPAVAIQYTYQTNSPAFLGATFGSAAGGTAPATISGTTAAAKAPIFFLT